MVFELPALPYEKNALEPHISSETLEYHHGKHHQTFVDTLNELVEGTNDTDRSLEAIIQSETGALFDQAAEAWNHTFYWHCLSPHGGGEPKGDLAKAVDTRYGSFSTFKERFNSQAMDNFGSGWIWLLKTEDGSLDIVSTRDTDTPIARGLTPLLAIDLWEHAYYIDHRDARKRYLESVWQIINWDFVSLNFS
ncbi:superoxide dismutase [Litchfieldella xinjiangensis]|uniref:superoxide dismutase n=1 Tax=Litchfieldella xinjiangensis TaxID=1166948 RepID=UPI0005BA153C|nr:Fe-Mn family superoxide dismutase [Halomonas xinjiangensis]